MGTDLRTSLGYVLGGHPTPMQFVLRPLGTTHHACLELLAQR